MRAKYFYNNAGGSRIMVRGDQGGTARKALQQGVAGGLAAACRGQGAEPPGGVWGEAPENFQYMPNFLLTFL